MNKKIVTLLCALLLLLCSCDKATTVNFNISQEADNFHVYRTITVINVRDNSVLYELTGYFSLNNNSTNELIVTSQIAEDDYRKDYIYLSDWTTYVVEQLDDAGVSAYAYELVIYPKRVLECNFDINVEP